MTFEEYKLKFGKTYNGDEEVARKAAFEENKKLWGQHESGAILGATIFSDMTPEEFKAANIRGLKDRSQYGDLPSLGMHEETPVEAGATIDWTTKGAVTPVKNQGQCGSCWSFSTTGGLEGAWQLSSGNLVSMSEQQFVDCDTGSSGCNGGLMDQAFGWAENQAIATESSYPYTARDGSCKSSFTTAIPRGGVTGYKDVQQSASGLTSAIMNSPVSVAIEADQAAFQQYTGGVITSGCGSNLDHGVLAVGVNSDGSIKVKNSWGTSWGVNGYVNIATGQCGITSSASYPVVSSSVSV
jgi:cathepsin L